MVDTKIELELDDELIEEFLLSLQNDYESIQKGIALLNKNPDDEVDLINDILRSMHTIKGNARMCELDLLTQFAHEIESVLIEVRENNLHYSDLLGEVVMHGLDKYKEACNDIFNKKDLNLELIKAIGSTMESIRTSSDSETETYANKVITLITGVLNERSIEAVDHNELDIVISDELRAELDYYKSLVLLLEEKSPFWHKRTERILELSNNINEHAGYLVDPVDLEAAVYLHDLGFVFLPESLILKDEKFNADEEKVMQKHTKISADLVARLCDRKEVANIVAQHHEWVDGSGYPQGIKDPDICPGAKLLAIVDAFESMTHPRVDRVYKRSILRAVTEINACSGTQFCSEWVQIFNAVIRKQYTSK